MAVGAIVKDGQIVETASQQSVSASATTSTQNNGYDKDSFLQLLVAQMKYQDPMEPTSNTEYISQYATFSQVEQLQNMASTMELSRSSAYVGKTVQISTTDSKGEATTLEGKVDFIKYENNKAYLSIDGNLYAADSVTAVIDQDYSDAYEIADALAEAINSLPSLDNLTTADADNLQTLIETYNGLTAYQQSFIDDSYADLLDKYYDKMVELKAAEKKAEENEAAANEASESKKAESEAKAAGTTEA